MAKDTVKIKPIDKEFNTGNPQTDRKLRNAGDMLNRLREQAYLSGSGYKTPNIFIEDEDPDSDDGEDGDIWLKYEA